MYTVNAAVMQRVSCCQRKVKESASLGSVASLVPAFCLAAFLLLGSSRLLGFSAGVLLMGVAHAVITVKGTHLASHGALSESQAWGRFWAVFFIEVRCAEIDLKGCH